MTSQNFNSDADFSSEELPDDLYQQILSFCEEGNLLSDNGKFEEAYNKFNEAFALIPFPREKWETSSWVLGAAGDMAFLLKSFTKAKELFGAAALCEGGAESTFIHLRLGQINYELGDLNVAAGELLEAYKLGGKDAFKHDDSKYFDFLIKRVAFVKSEDLKKLIKNA